MELTTCAGQPWGKIALMTGAIVGGKMALRIGGGMTAAVGARTLLTTGPLNTGFNRDWSWKK